MDTTPPITPREQVPMIKFDAPATPRSTLPPPETAINPTPIADLAKAHALGSVANLPPTPLPKAPLLTPHATLSAPVVEHTRTNRPIQRWLTHREHTRRAPKPATDSRVSSSTTQAPLSSTTSTQADERMIDAGDDDNAINVDGQDQSPAVTSSDSDTESEIDSVDSDSESTDEEFGKSDNPRMDPKTRAGLEAMVFEGKQNTTLRYKSEWEQAKKREDLEVKTERFKKYAWDAAAGGVNQATSFGLGGIAVAFTGNPWLFPIVSCIASDLLGDRLA